MRRFKNHCLRKRGTAPGRVLRVRVTLAAAAAGPAVPAAQTEKPRLQNTCFHVSPQLGT